MRQPFKIFPSIGYINTQFQIVCFSNNLQINIEYNGRLEKTIDFSKVQTAVLTGLNNQGKYRAYCKIENEEFNQTFEIKDAIRLGTSEFKRAFTFDQIPYSFFLMKDRTLIYNENHKTFWEENDISPTYIKQIDSNNLLFITKLDNTNKDSITNYGIYSLIDFSMTAELINCYIEIKHNDHDNCLWLFNPNQNQIVGFLLKVDSASQLKQIFNIDDVIKYKLTKHETHIYIETTNRVDSTRQCNNTV